ncbi:hypothetical protein ESA_00301 [Cronobacter sakazakii ATCC BAA-894]|uniref:Uncharacterized protein n=1 Tax=Cronobacter sakazakii (strain ATCC BAA-894) TaxID=290339 RepID=A7MLZ7_CROS8|nr:hypothetical protein ESA_00301 [Cronobacter sakazakii ATCC BAA-894]
MFLSLKNLNNNCLLPQRLTLLLLASFIENLISKINYFCHVTISCHSRKKRRNSA